MADFSVPSKLVGEIFTLTFNFLNKLLWGEEITSAVCTVEVTSGEDADPSDLLLFSTTINSAGTIVTQKVYQGIPGVIYKVICTAETDSSHTYIKGHYLAILPDDNGAPPLVFSGQIETVEMSSGA